MTKRRKRLLGIVGVFAAIGTLALPPVHWRLIGWARREPFWRGRAASYYAARIRHSIQYSGGTLDTRPHTQVEEWVRGNVSDGLADTIWGGPVPFLDPQVEQPDLAALPVIEALMGDPDERVRVIATDAMRELSDGPVEISPTLLGLLDDHSPTVRAAAARTVGSFGRKARLAVPKLLELLRDKGTTALGGRPEVGMEAAEALRQIDPDAWKAAGRP